MVDFFEPTPAGPLLFSGDPKTLKITVSSGLQNDAWKTILQLNLRTIEYIQNPHGRNAASKTLGRCVF